MPEDPSTSPVPRQPVLEVLLRGLSKSGAAKGSSVSRTLFRDRVCLSCGSRPSEVATQPNPSPTPEAAFGKTRPPRVTHRSVEICEWRAWLARPHCTAELREWGIVRSLFPKTGASRNRCFSYERSTAWWSPAFFVPKADTGLGITSPFFVELMLVGISAAIDYIVVENALCLEL